MANGEHYKLNWSIIQIVIQILILVFMGGIAWNSFETSASHDKDMKDERVYNALTYMSKELSLEKWDQNNKKHDDIQKSLDTILLELKRKRLTE